MTSHLLKAMGLWIWALIAISLSVTLISVNSRVVSLVRAQHSAVRPSAVPSTKFTPPVGHDFRPSVPKVGSAGPQISRIIGKEMLAAQNALRTQQWTEALNQLDAAQAKPGLTPFDQMSIYRFAGFAQVKLNNLKGAQAAYEKALATGAVSAEDKTQMTRTLFSIAATTNQYQATVDYGTEMSDAGTATPNVLAIIAQGYFQLKDCQNSAAWSDKAMTASRNAGEVPKENLYLFKLQCASNAGNNAAMIPILVDLIRLNNKSVSWNTLLRIERQDERDDHNTLMLYRVMYNTSAMTAGSDYMEMAQLLGDAALPAEAQTVLEKGIGAGLIKDEQKERTNRLLASFKTRADTDKMGLEQLDAEATDSPAGELDVKLGEIYYGFGDYQNAITAIARGIGKGQIKHQDEAYVYLGLSQAAIRDSAAAKEALMRLKTVPNVSRRVAMLWQLYAETSLRSL